ncbi:DegT/DnrJ/EryC1/StrS family aminotransferase [Myxococcota bacterium]|nr:DegT/DnrJ/EryC1/StrS family aminotransferase [Myxococcota bacterium]
MKIPITRPHFDEADFAALRAPLETGWVVQGPHVAGFEAAFSAYSGAAHSVACASCTAGLHLALAELEIGPGDEVIVPAFTWVSTAYVALHLGATPVFCDVDLRTFNIDVAQIEGKITSKTKAIIPVHLFGLPAQMPAILEIAAAHGLAVVEDAACGLGAFIDGQHVGTFGDMGAFSFHPRKAITTGEGGMITTGDPRRAARLESLRNHGAGVSDLSRHDAKGAYLLGAFELLGFNYRMTDLQGALGETQMAKVPWIQARRAALAARYTEALADLGWLWLPEIPPGDTHGWQSYVTLYAPSAPSLARLDALNAGRDALMARLEAAGIATRQGTHAAHALGLFRQRLGVQPQDHPQAWMAERLSMALPLYPTMTEAEQGYVIDQLRALGP